MRDLYDRLATLIHDFERPALDIMLDRRILERTTKKMLCAKHRLQGCSVSGMLRSVPNSVPQIP